MTLIPLTHGLKYFLFFNFVVLVFGKLSNIITNRAGPEPPMPAGRPYSSKFKQHSHRSRHLHLNRLTINNVKGNNILIVPCFSRWLLCSAASFWPVAPDAALFLSDLRFATIPRSNTRFLLGVHPVMLRVFGIYR